MGFRATVGAWLLVGCMAGEPPSGQRAPALRSADPVLGEASWTVTSGQEGANLGRSVASAGDVNGDGFDDVVIGVYRYDGANLDGGQAWVFHGSSTGLEPTAAWTGEADQAAAQFGSTVASAGDVNGDGFDDVLVVADDYNFGSWNEGRAFLYLGSAAGLETNPAWIAESDEGHPPNKEYYFGVAIAGAGDVNGDGFDDLLVGLGMYDNPEFEEGRAALYLGSPDGLETTSSWTAEPDSSSAYFGWDVASAGDVNGDGYADVVVGADSETHGEFDEGRAYVYLGSPTGLGSAPAWTGEPDQSSGHYGWSVDSAGDVDGDGFDDLLIGAWGIDDPQEDEGVAYLYLGSSTGLSASPAWTVGGDQAGAALGYSLAGAGDVNGDGLGDVLVGAYLANAGAPDEGQATVFLGSCSGEDTDEDGFPDTCDACPGFDDRDDADQDGIPDGCEPAPEATGDTAAPAATTDTGEPGPVSEPDDTDDPDDDPPGCGCATGSPGGLGFLVAALALVRRRAITRPKGPPASG